MNRLARSLKPIVPKLPARPLKPTVAKLPIVYKVRPPSQQQLLLVLPRLVNNRTAVRMDVVVEGEEEAVSEMAARGKVRIASSVLNVDLTT